MENKMRLLRRAIALDPSYALAHAYLASIQWLTIANYWRRHDDPVVSDALAHAHMALALDGDDPEVLLLASIVVSTRGGDVDGAIAIAEKSLALGPRA